MTTQKSTRVKRWTKFGQMLGTDNNSKSNLYFWCTVAGNFYYCTVH